jgi:hypothetical protein
MADSNDLGPTVGIVLNRDLLFGSRIKSALDTLGLQPRFVANANEFVAAMVENRESTAIGIIDMNGPVSWDVISGTLSRGDIALAPTLAFGPHVDVESRRAAKSAGITRILSNGQFHGDMVALIERYRQR